MSNRYYVSSNELYHWKYIKREKKNGKWVYYYDTGANAKKNYEQAKQKLDTYKRQEEGALARDLVGKGHEHSSGHAMQRYVNSHYKDYGPRKKLEKQYEEAKSEYYDSPMGKKEQRAENLKRTTQKVKDWAKDKLGYDEKQAASTARTKATIAKNELSDTEKKNREWRDKYSDYDPQTGEAIRKPGYDKVNELADWQDNYYRELAWEAENNAKIAEQDYKKTPLGVYEVTSEKIENAVERGKERLKNKVGYLEKGIVEGRQENVDFYKEKVKEVEDQLRQIRREHPEAKAGIEYNEKRLKEYREKLGAANRSLQEARDSYMDTPIGKLSKNERAYNFVDALLNGASKKRKK